MPIFIRRRRRARWHLSHACRWIHRAHLRRGDGRILGPRDSIATAECRRTRPARQNDPRRPAKEWTIEAAAAQKAGRHEHIARIACRFAVGLVRRRLSCGHALIVSYIANEPFRGRLASKLGGNSRVCGITRIFSNIGINNTVESRRPSLGTSAGRSVRSRGVHSQPFARQGKSESVGERGFLPKTFHHPAHCRVPVTDSVSQRQAFSRPSRLFSPRSLDYRQWPPLRFPASPQASPAGDCDVADRR